MNPIPISFQWVRATYSTFLTGFSVASLRAFFSIVILSISAPLAVADWPLARGDVAGTGATADALPTQLGLLWEVEIGGLGFDAGPVIADGKVYCADADGRVIALDLDSGKEVWRLELESGFVASPSVSEGVLYVGDFDGTLRALDASTGKEKWNFETGLEIAAGPTPIGNEILVTSQDGILYCLMRDSGALKWKYETGDQLRCGATLAGERTYLGGCDAKLHVVDVALGTAVGEPISIDAPTGSTPSVDGGRVFVPTYAGEIFAFSTESNEVIWRFKDPQLSQEFQNSVAVSAGLVIASSRNRRLFALDIRTGKVLWEQTLRKRADGSPVIAGDRVVLAAADGRVLLFDLKTGEEKWMFEVKGGFLGSAAVADGKVVVASDKGTVYCFGQAPKPAS